MEPVYGILLLMALMIYGVPVAWSFAGVLAYFVWAYDTNTTTLFLQGFRGLNSVILLALPLFILAGYLMETGGIARRLITFMEASVKGRRDGLGSALVMTSAVFGAISGTATAAVASIGTIMVDPLAERGYPRPYTSALLGISSLLGILIPPSITLILFGVVTRQSITALFAATVVPAIVLIIGLIIYNKIACKTFLREFDEARAAKPDEYKLTQTDAERDGFWKSAFKAVPALFMPLVILGGIYGGFATPTEAASIAVVLSIVVGFFIYRNLTPKRLITSIVKAGETTGTIIMILLFSLMIGRIMVAESVPQDLTKFVTSLTENKILILLIVNAFLTFVGMIMDDVSVTVVIAPLFMSLMVSVGVDPVHFASIVACSVVIGANSPPMAPILYMACKIGKASIHESVKPALQLIIFVALPVMLMVTYVPSLSLFLPRLLGVY
ncbi:TRAP transporter large permease [Epibacterium ulvae]|uniref:TRAP transporter large permease n=1 Tax=Epibacterium ulvae TaxID=1156985 RepID=UPI00249205D3|nr:TRAP transporter large permease [Epibacterium ulvae]